MWPTGRRVSSGAGPGGSWTTGGGGQIAPLSGARRVGPQPDVSRRCRPLRRRAGFLPSHHVADEDQHPEPAWVPHLRHRTAGSAAGAHAGSPARPGESAWSASTRSLRDARGLPRPDGVFFQIIHGVLAHKDQLYHKRLADAFANERGLDSIRFVAASLSRWAFVDAFLLADTI